MLHAKAIFPSTCIARGFFPKRKKQTDNISASVSYKTIPYFYSLVSPKKYSASIPGPTWAPVNGS